MKSLLLAFVVEDDIVNSENKIVRLKPIYNDTKKLPEFDITVYIESM